MGRTEQRPSVTVSTFLTLLNSSRVMYFPSWHRRDCEHFPAATPARLARDSSVDPKALSAVAQWELPGDGERQLRRLPVVGRRLPSFSVCRPATGPAEKFTPREVRSHSAIYLRLFTFLELAASRFDSDPSISSRIPGPSQLFAVYSYAPE